MIEVGIVGISPHLSTDRMLAGCARLPDHPDPDPSPLAVLIKDHLLDVRRRRISLRSAAVVVVAFHNCGKSSPKEITCARSAALRDVGCSRRQLWYSAQFARPRGAAPPRRAQANAPPAGSPAPRHRIAGGPAPPRNGPARAGATTGAPASGPLPQTRPKRRRPGRADQAPAPPAPGSLPRRRSAGLGSPGNATRRAAAGRRYTDIRGSCRPARNSADPCAGRTDRKLRSPAATPGLCGARPAGLVHIG